MFLFKMSREIFTEITAQKHFPIDFYMTGNLFATPWWPSKGMQV